jgi:hypothetical protein
MIKFIKWLFQPSEYELTIEHLGTVKKYHISKIYSLSTTSASFKTIDDEKHTLKSSGKMSWELRKIKHERN